MSQPPDPDRGAEVGHRSPGERQESPPPRTIRLRRWGLLAGLVGAVLVYLLMPAEAPSAARVTAGTAVLMGIWWMTEAIPIPATALIPLAVFPVIGGAEIDDVGASYGSDIIFLFMGGFILALAMQRWNLHRRIALVTVRTMGTNPAMVVAGFMVATGFLSMWVSNTATAVMMLPIGVSVLMLVVRLEEGRDGADEDAPEAKGGGPPTSTPSSGATSAPR